MEQVPFVLSGGGARGMAHIGVLQAFAEAGITPSAISGTSAGALVGAFIAAGMTPAQVTAMLHEEWRLHRTRWKVLRGELRRRGIGHVEIRTRGLNWDPQSLRRELRLPGGPAGAQLVFTRLQGRAAAVLVSD